MSAPNHFLDLCDFDETALRQMLDEGTAYKLGKDIGTSPWLGKTLVMIFEKPSTRTRVSFEVGVQQLGGRAVVLGTQESQLGRGETIADTARVLSRYADAIMIRTSATERMDELASFASIPVINGLTDGSHPCQIMADIMTAEEHLGSIGGRTVAWCGDGNNVASSWIHAAVIFGFEIRLACPEQLQPSKKALDWAAKMGGNVVLTSDPHVAVAGADVVVTDTWVSMGDEDAGTRHNMLTPYRVDSALMAEASPEAVFMHCLPAHRGDEVTDEVMDGPQSVVWDEAENRLHAQKGVLAWCLGI
jgi:ornithine carbamoyltransferase